MISKFKLFFIHNSSFIIHNSLLNRSILFLFIFLLPTQLGRHFFFPFSYLSGVRTDYLAPTVFLSDLFAVLLIFINWKNILKLFKQSHISPIFPILLFVLILINIAQSSIWKITLYRWIKIGEWLGVFIIFRQLFINKYHLLLLKGFLIGAVFQTILTLLQFVNTHSLQGVFYWFGERAINLSMTDIAKASFQGNEFLRPYGTFSHPNSMAGFYLLLYFWTITVKLPKNKGYLPRNRSSLGLRGLQPLLQMFCAILILLSFSKITIMTWIILNSLYLLHKNNFACKICTLAKIITPLIIGFVFINIQSDPLSLQKRIVLIGDAVSIFLKHPLFGVGLGNYLAAQNQITSQFKEYFLQPVHNIFLLWLSETGIAITLLATWQVTKAAKVFWHKSYIWILLVIFITGMFDHYWLTLQQNWLLTAVIFGLIINKYATTQSNH